MQKFSQQSTLRMPSDDVYLRQLLKPDLVNGPWIAGGAVIQWFRGQPVQGHDVDVFFKNQQQYEEWDKVFQHTTAAVFEYPSGISNNTKDCSLIFSSNNARTYKYEHWHLQLIRSRFYDSVDELLDYFDITACKIATDGRVWYTNNPKTIEHIENYVLDMDEIRPENAIKRLFKYWTYNYQPTVDLIERIQQTPDLQNNFSNSTDYDA